MVGVETLWRILTKTTVVCGVERVPCRGCHVSRVWETTVGWVRGSVSCVRIPRCSLKQWLLTLQAMIENLTWCLASTIITVLQICWLLPGEVWREHRQSPEQQRLSWWENIFLTTRAWVRSEMKGQFTWSRTGPILVFRIVGTVPEKWFSVNTYTRPSHTRSSSQLKPLYFSFEGISPVIKIE